MAAKELKLLHISPYAVQDPRLGGVPQSVMALCDALCQAGHEVTIWASDAGNARFSRPESEAGGVHVRLFDSRLEVIGTAINSPIVPKLMLLDPGMIQGFDLVHLHGYWSSFTPSIARACRRRGIPLVLQPRGSLVQSNQKESLKRLFQFLFRREIIDATAIAVALTEAERGQLLASGFEDSKVRIIPNFVSLPPVALPPADVARRTLGLPADVPLILYLGRLHPKKGLKELVLALTRLKLTIPEAVLALAGPDDGMLAELKDFTKRAGPPGIFFVGPLDSTMKWTAFAAADAFCLPSAFEAFPRVVLEAAAAGVPIVLSSQVSLPQLLEAGGVISSDPTPDQLAKQLTKVLLDPTLRSQLVQNARNCIDNFFSARAVISSLERAYESALRRMN